MKKLIKQFILFLITRIEKIEFKHIKLDQNDHNKKIIDTRYLMKFVNSDTGMQEAFAIHQTQPYRIYEIETAGGKKLKSADNHIVFGANFNEIFVRELSIGDEIITSDGIDVIKNISKNKYSVSMFDISLNDKNHRFFSNGILSHNTITSSIFLAWYAIFHFDRNILVVANRLNTTIEIIDKIKHVIKNIPFFMKPGVIADGKTGMHFDNNCRLFSQATTATAALGFAIHLLYADEFAHIHDNLVRPFYRSIYPTLASSKISKIIISSTPNGKNLFYELWSNAIKGKNDYVPYRVDWWDVPGRDEEWRKREIANLGSVELFNQEYGNQFLASNRMLLSSAYSDFIDRTTHKFKYKEIFSFHQFDFDYDKLRWADSFNPDSISDDDRFVFSVDISDGIGQDNTVINIFKLELLSPAQARKKKIFFDESDFFRLRQVGIFVSSTYEPAQTGVLLQHLIFDLFNPEHTATIVETNFKSGVVFNILERHRSFYPELLVHTKHSINAKIKQPGVKIRKQNRDSYIRNLKTMLLEKRIVIADKETNKEISNFGINDKGKFEAQTGHDDIAMTLVFLGAFFESDQFEEMVEELYDLHKGQIIKTIDDKLEQFDDNDEDAINYINLLNS